MEAAEATASSTIYQTHLARRGESSKTLEKNVKNEQILLVINDVKVN